MYEFKKRYKKVIPSTCLIATTVPMHLLPIDFMHLKRSSAVGRGGWVGGDMSIAVGGVDHLIILPSTCKSHKEPRDQRCG